MKDSVIGPLRTRLAAKIRGDLDTTGSADLPTIADGIAADVLKDQSMLRELVPAMVRLLCYQVGASVISGTRVVMAGETLLTRDAIRTRGRRLAGKWAGFMEHVQDRYIRLSDMTREELLQAAEEREARAAHDGEMARLWRALAAQLDEGEQVSARFNSEQIESVRQEIAGRVPVGV